MQPDERLAVIDLGSNSFRLVVFTAAEGWWKRTDEIYEPVRIGEGLAASGRLGEQPMRAGAGDARRVRPLLPRRAGLENGAVDAVATSAIRDAENAAELPRARARADRAADSRAQPRGGGALRLSGGDQLDDARRRLRARSRRRLAAAGAASAERLARESGSWSLGAVRMTERFLPPNGPAKRRQIEELREHVAPRARAGLLAARGRPAPGRHRGDRAQPRHRRPACRRAAFQRRAGDGDRARGARRAGGAARRAARRRAQHGARHQASPRRPDPRRRARRAGGARGRRLRRAGGDRGGAARGGVLRAAAQPGRSSRRCSRTAGARA